MKTKRVATSVYVTTDGHAKIRRADSAAGELFGTGWHLFVDSDWWQTYATKAEALEAYVAHITD
jgi:hypothetical protein